MQSSHRIQNLIIILLLGIMFPFTAQASSIYSIYIPCEIGASAYALLPDGSRYDLGTILSLPQTSRWPSYTASQWGQAGSVCASAVNAVHLLCSVEKGKGRTISILPEKTIAPAAGKKTYFSIQKDAGTGLFGGWAPPVGTPVYIIKKGSSQSRLSSENFPEEGDVLFMPVEEKEHPFLIDIENRPGGRVIAWNSRGVNVIARVIRPVYGVGRFGGTLFQTDSRIRANHTGVIDISTSPVGEIGGFQILPLFHAGSKEMASAWTLTQWMIIGTENGHRLIGSRPLFSDGLVPGGQLSDHLWDIWSTYGRRPLVLCRIDGGSWQALPKHSGKDDKALFNVTHIRLYYPFTAEPNR